MSKGGKGIFLLANSSSDILVVIQYRLFVSSAALTSRIQYSKYFEYRLRLHGQCSSKRALAIMQIKFIQFCFLQDHM